jgi:FkbM family methyltransferase
MHRAHNVWMPNGDDAKWLIQTGQDGLPAYQYQQIEACIKACGKRLGTAIDGGAHVGLWAIHLLKAFKKVVGVEPIAANVECLERNASNPKFTLVPMALTDYTGTIEMTSRGPRSFQWNIAGLAPATSPAIDVPCCTIDSMGLSDVDLIKLDVEGSEYEALRGAEHILQRDKPVVMIEEKLDPKKRATRYLEGLGMKRAGHWRYDHLFTWGDSEKK